MSAVRLWLVGLGLIAALLTVVGRSVQVQIFNGDRLRNMAEDQYLKEIELSAPRGNIYDRAGRTLAVSVAVDSVYVNPRRFDRSMLPALAKALGMKSRAVEKRIGKRRTFAWIQRRVKPAQAEAVRALKIRGVHFTSESKRYYPNRELGSHMLGFVGVDGEGLAGLELKYDTSLRGRTVGVSALRDARGRALSTGDTLPVMTLEGEDLHLTIDAAVQHLTELALADAVSKHEAVAGMAVVFEVDSGAVLALANVPTFNPNEPGKAGRGARRNRAITDVFEPGSTLKPLVVAAALDGEVIKVDDRIDCEGGAYPVGRHVIRDTHPHDVLEIADIIAKSSNIGALKIGTALGAESLYAALRQLGFGARTDIGLPGEVRGLLAKPKRWSQARLATISFGQGIGVSAVQLTAAIGAIASGGIWHPPYVLDRIVGHDDSVRWQHGQERDTRVFSETTARSVAAMMERVTQPGGTGARAGLPGIRVAGKTGTAQKVDLVAGGYSADKRIGSFIGFAPVEAPRVVVLVVIDEPEGISYGGVVAAPAFREIMRGTLAHLGISVAFEEPEAVADASDAAVDQMPRAEVAPISFKPSEDERLGGVARMPDLRGLDIRRAASAALRTGLELKVEGRGLVVRQLPAPGTPLEGEAAVELQLEERS